VKVKSCLKVMKDQVFVEVSVYDKGNELSSAAQQSMFTQPTQTRSSPSTGVGLFICKQICEMTGGSMSYDFENLGNKFSFLMKINLSAASQPRISVSSVGIEEYKSSNNQSSQHQYNQIEESKA